MQTLIRVVATLALAALAVNANAQSKTLTGEARTEAVLLVLDHGK